MGSDYDSDNYYEDESDNNSIGGSAVDGEDEREKILVEKFSYTVLSGEDIRNHQEEDVTEISSLLCVPPESAWILLLHYKWDVEAVHEAWYGDEEKVRTTTGLLDKPVVHYSDTDEVRCLICFEDYPSSGMYAVGCGHRFCRSCWGEYISTAINDGPGCLTLRCPDPSCAAAVGQDTISELAPEGRDKYVEYLTRSYVETNGKIKWCPAPGCDYAVESDYAVNCVVGSTKCDVSCECTNKFCWNCTEDAHHPVDCDMVAKWITKNNAESENTTWILANSKPCPKCRRPIEKSHGCMHMTCPAPCKFHFCWLCLGSWSDHGSATGGFYACNVYEKAKQEGGISEAERVREMAKHALQRYTHYYERWAANESSRKKAIESLQKLEASTFNKLEYKLKTSRLQLAFITVAWEQIIECRRVLKWTYAYGYYLLTEERAKRELFEYLQREADGRLECLHECTEKDLQVFLDTNESVKEFESFRAKLIDLTVVTRKHFENLIKGLENGLTEVEENGCSSSNDTGGDTKGEESWGWSCEACTYFNQKNHVFCAVCNTER